jgi:hypothetical protein
MKTSFKLTALLIATASALTVTPLSAIKIVVPDQYKDQVEAIKEAERSERKQELQGANESADSRLTVDLPEGKAEDNQSPEVATDEFLVQSVIEATDAATEFELNLAAGEGIISGQIIDKESGQPLSGVAILLEDTNIATVTDSEGRYSIGPAPAGEYTVSFVKTGYIEANVTDYAIVGGEVSVFPFGLPPRPADMSDEVYELQDFTVTAEQANSMMALIEMQQASVGQLQFLSSEDFERYTGSDVADFVKRLTGVNVVEGKFAVVRGLGDRYNSTLMNGLPIPSSDPIRQGVQLDLFPTSIIESVVATKDVSASFPSNSSGAAFDLITKSYPEEWAFKLKTGFSVNSNAKDSLLLNPNFDAPIGTPGGDFKLNKLLGRDRDDFRDDSVAVTADAVGNDLLDFGGQSFTFSGGNTFDDVFGIHKIGFVSSISYSSSSDTLLGEQQDRFGRPSRPPGFFFMGAFPVSIPAVPGSFTEGELPASALNYNLTNSVVKEDSSFLVGLGAVLDKDANHSFDLAYLRSVSNISEVTRRDGGTLQGVDRNINDRGFGSNGSNELQLTNDIIGRAYGTRGGNDLFTQGQDFLSHEVRTLEALQLRGSNKLSFLNRELTLTWGMTEASALSQIGDPNPDAYIAGQSTLIYLRNATDQTINTETDLSQISPAGLLIGPGDYVATGAQGFAESFVEDVIRTTAREIDDEIEGHRYDIEFPIIESLTLNGGSFYSKTTRNVFQTDRLFRLGGGTFIIADNTGDLAEDSLNSTSGEVDLFSFAEINRDIASNYLSMDLKPLENLEFDLGYRATSVEMAATGSGQLYPAITLFSPPSFLNSGIEGNPSITNGELLGYTQPTPGLIDEDYLLPAFSAKYSFFDGFSLRLAYSETIALPSARELSPVFTVDPLSGDRIFGNPTLQVSEVTNKSIGLSYSRPEGGYSLGLGVFQKDIAQPIEQIGIVDPNSGTSVQSYLNNENEAMVEGVEFEFQMDLDFLLEKLDLEVPYLEYFSIGANVAVIDASVPFPESVARTYVDETLSTPNHPVSPYTDVNGDSQLPTGRRLFDQPEYTYNAYLSYNHEDWGTAVTLSIFGQSDVLATVGSGSGLTLDQYTLPYEQLDLTISQTFGKERNWKLSFSVENITDTERGIGYDSEIVDEINRLTYKVGRDYGISLSAEF